jgi:hypothetical protein
MYKVINGDNYCVINGQIELHPHNEHMKLYQPGDTWQAYTNYRWVDCVNTPLWAYDVAYRKHPHSDTMKQYMYWLTCLERWCFIP